VLALAVLRLLSGDTNQDSSGSNSPAGLRPGVYEVERVVDGDTLVLNDGRARIRLQGVDTPETVKEHSPVEPWGPDASAFTKAFIADAGGKVRIEIDGEPLDQHGRYLGFLWHGERMLNEELVRNGLARATLQYDFSERKKGVLRRAQREARRAHLGMWSVVNE
jgi:micrococcal nuclease